MSPRDRSALLPPAPREATLIGLPAVVLPMPREPARVVPALPVASTPRLEREIRFLFGSALGLLTVTVQARGGDCTVRLRLKRGGAIVRLEELCDADICELGRKVANSLRVVESEVVS